MRRRVALVVGIAGLMVLGVAAVALAGTFVGNNQANTITGGANSDNIYGLNGGDTLRGAGLNDVIECGVGADNCHGDDGNDRVSARPGPDDIFGDANNDILFAADGVYGNDFLNGGTGNDVCIFDANLIFGADDRINCERMYGVISQF